MPVFLQQDFVVCIIDCAVELIGCQIKCPGKIKQLTGHLVDLWMEPGKIHQCIMGLKHLRTQIFYGLS